jgi:uncharacterized membrane protein YsdA (DUF1294 family)
MLHTLWWIALAVNLLTFAVYGYDKLCARRGWRRISEARLLWLAFLGSVVGAWAGVSVFRHKTQKRSFRWRLLLVSLLNPLWLLVWYSWSS